MAQVILYPGWQVFDANGNPAAGAKARFFTAGTSTPVNVFSNSTLVTPHAVPVVADSQGRFPTIYAASGAYKIKVTDSLDVDLFPEVDNWTILTDLTTTELSFPTVTKTANYTVLAADRGKVLEFDAAGSTLIVTLKAATLGVGFPIWIVNSGATGTVQLEFDPGETLLGATTYQLVTQHQSAGITSRGASGWRLFSQTLSTASTAQQLTGTASGVSSTPDSVAALWEAGADIGDTAAITIGEGGYFNLITSTVAITSFVITTDKAGRSFKVRFNTVRTLTHNATSLILPGAANITTAAGDIAFIRSLGGGNVVVEAYTKASGFPIISGITLGTEQATTSGTSIDFTGIPATAKRIVIMFSGVSTNGTSEFLVQLGDAGGVETSGYTSGASTASTADISTIGFILIGQALSAAATYSGKVIIDLENAASFRWVSSGTIIRVTDGFTFNSAGVKATSAALDRVRITTVGGVNTFDAGAINISYE